jgi:hypothetical protein
MKPHARLSADRADLQRLSLQHVSHDSTASTLEKRLPAQPGIGTILGRVMIEEL